MLKNRMQKIKFFTLFFIGTFFLSWLGVGFLQVPQAMAQCGGGTCPADACGNVTIDYGGYFSPGVTTENDLTCYYDSTCVNDTVPCGSGDAYANRDLNICFSTGGQTGCIGNQRCTISATLPGETSCFNNNVVVSCSGGCSSSGSPTPTSNGGGGGPTAAPTATPVPPRNFYGSFYQDASAVTSGLGGTDNLCTGSTATPVSLDSTSSVSAVRSGETSNGIIGGSSYSISTSTSNSDYTVALELPFPPPDPLNAWQCACNADPTDPYRCLYTNRQPSNTQQVNFFLKLANTTNTAWFQTLGGSSWALNNIESLVPSATCTPPTCSPALITNDPSGTADSAGFPLTDTGTVITSTTGGTYIHESGDRTTAAQAKATGVSVPVENYDYFYGKLGDSAQTLPNAGKPIVGTTLAVYKYTGNLTLTQASPWNLINTEKIVVFVDGDLTIDDTVSGQNRITTVATGGDAFLMFIVSGDITITSRVGYSSITTNPATPNIANVEGVFMADGLFTVAREAGTTDRKFIGAGTFVGWEGVDLQRNFDNGSTPTLNNAAATETFIFRPDFLVNTPKEVQSAQMTWREVEPSF